MNRYVLKPLPIQFYVRTSNTNVWPILIGALLILPGGSARISQQPVSQ